MPRLATRESTNLIYAKKTSNSFDTGGTVETAFDSKSSRGSRYRKEKVR